MKKLFSIGTMIAMIVGLLLALSAPANASDSDSITVESVTYTETASKADVKSETRAVINGATQLTWWYPNHNVKVTKKQVRKAPHIKVTYSSCARQSKSIAKQAHGASIVVAKVGSVICNTGMNGNIIGGFKWKVTKGPAVLKWNSKLKLYEHVYNLIGGKLVKTCRNRMGGKVDEMYTHVTQVRYLSDVLLDIELESSVEVSANVKASLECPSGTLYGEASASASGSASASLRVMVKSKITAVNAKMVELLTSARAKAQTSAKAAAQAKVTLKCNSNPPPHDECPDIPGDQPEGYECNPPVEEPPVFVQFREFNDLEVNWVDDHCVTVDTPKGHTATVYWEAKFGSFATSSKTAQDGVQVCSDYKAPSEVPASGTDEITVRAVDTVTDKSVTKTTDPFTIHPTAGHPE